MSVYDDGSEAIRDTVKWLVAFVPIASVIGAIIVVVPRMVDDARPASETWLEANWAALAACALVVAGVVLILVFGTQVLSAAPKDFTRFIGTPKELAEAFAAGVGSPFFDTESDFRDTLTEAQIAWQGPVPVAPQPGQGQDAALLATRIEAASATTDNLRAWAWFRHLKAALGRFLGAFALGVLLILVGIVIAATTTPPAAGAIDAPTRVDVELSEPGAAALLHATACDDPAATSFIAVAGTWEQPVLAANGPGCSFGARWEPKIDEAELAVPPTGP